MSVSSGTVSVGIGPQCLKCRKRRVKCDSTKPTCRRCREIGTECPGYKRKLKFVPVNASEFLNISRRNARQDKLAKTVTLGSTSIPYFPQDSHELVMLDSIRNYNEHVLPFRSPSQKPFNRQKMYEDTPWQILPKIVRLVLIVTVRTLQAAKNELDPSLQTDVCLYRGQSLRELKEYLPGAVEDPMAIALASVLLLIGADMYILTESSWPLHLQAAARIIALRGGLARCMRELPFLRAPLVNYMVIDILTATTSNSALLFSESSTIQEHRGLVALIPGLEADLLANSHTCPWPILQAIVRTNMLRNFARSFPQSPNVSPEKLDPATWMKEITEILDKINSFNAGEWATTICRLGKPLPEPLHDLPTIADVSALVSLGLCYQSAALIYLTLSSGHMQNNKIRETVISAKRVIDESAGSLFELSSADNNGPLHEQLWKFLIWPMVVSVYSRVGWDISSQDEPVDAEVERLRMRARQLRSRNLLVASEHMRKIQDMKEASPSPWTWDAGFPARHAFAV